MPRIVRRPQAHDDLLSIWNYVASDDPDAADRLLDRIYARLQSLAASPLIGTTRPELHDDLRSSTIGN